MLHRPTARLSGYCLQWLFAISLLATPAFAAIDVYQFSSDTERERFQALTSELRCPKCQNQNIADSNAPIAQDLRTKIVAMLNAHKSDQEIVDYMIARYGDFVLYQPRVNTKTYLLWFGPLAFLLIGIAIVILIAQRNAAKIKQTEPTAPGLSKEQQRQLETLLNETGKK